MKVTCTTKQLVTAVELASKMAGKQLSVSALQGVLFIATKKSIQIRATNLNVGIDIEIPAKVEEEGTVLLRGEVIMPLLQNNTHENIILELDNENLKVTTLTSKNIIKALPLEDFPTLPIVEGESFSIEAKLLIEGIRSVFFASAVTDIKPEIASVFIYSDSMLTFVGTDSFRLAEKKVKMKQVPNISKILLPSKNIPDILKVLDSCSGEVVVTFNKNQLSFTVGGLYFTTRLIDGAFPDYRMIILKEVKTKVVLLKQELLTTLRLATVFVDKFSQITFTVLPAEKKVCIHSKNTDIGTSETVLSAVVEGQAMETAFNLKYFVDVFQSIPGDSVSIECLEPNRPIMIRSVQDNSFLYLLMPTNR